MSGMKLLFSALILSGLYSVAPGSGTSDVTTPARETFAFWYDPWQPGTTIQKLKPAKIIVGVPANAIPEIRAAHKLALQYVTYYQSTFQHAFLKDRADLPNVGFEVNGTFEKSKFGGQDNYVLCPNSKELESRVLRHVDESLQAGFDGYFVDNTFLSPSAGEVCNAQHAHLSANSTGGQAYVSLIAAVRQKLKSANPTALLILNPGNPAALSSVAPGAFSLWDLSDYVLWESYGYTSFRGAKHDDWKHCLGIADRLTDVQKSKVLALSYPANMAEARFSFAMARIAGFQWTANLGDSMQNTDREGGEFGAFLNDIPFQLGEPLGGSPSPVQTDGLLHRLFQNGEVFANVSSKSVPISVPKAGAIYLGDRTFKVSAPQTIVLQPMTAAVILKRP